MMDQPGTSFKGAASLPSQGRFAQTQVEDSKNFPVSSVNKIIKGEWSHRHSGEWSQWIQDDSSGREKCSPESKFDAGQEYYLSDSEEEEYWKNQAGHRSDSDSSEAKLDSGRYEHPPWSEFPSPSESELSESYQESDSEYNDGELDGDIHNYPGTHSESSDSGSEYQDQDADDYSDHSKHEPYYDDHSESEGNNEEHNHHAEEYSDDPNDHYNYNEFCLFA